MKENLKSIAEWERYFTSPAGEEALRHLYPKDTDRQKRRYLLALWQFAKEFGDRPVAVFSAPGRTELCGNHTDHQRGCVLAAAVTLDILAIAAPNDMGSIRVLSESYGAVAVELADLSPREEEKNHTAALIRGVTAGIGEQGYDTGGFDAYITSEVPQGSGLSSSAAFEVLLGTIENHLFCQGRLPPVKIAQIGQFAENKYFGKPCGLMDQTASSVGGAICVDFYDPGEPLVDRIPCDLSALGYDLCIINTGGSHANLTRDYADITEEMGAVAHLFGCEVLRQVAPEDFFDRLPLLRGRVSDRAILRAMHYFDENIRVAQQTEALRESDMVRYRRTMLESGRSSFMLLQNIYSSGGQNERSIALALALTERQLSGCGAWRVHGGGFAGTIQALTPHEKTREYMEAMGKVFGADHCHQLAIRPVGGWSIPIHF